MRYYIYFQFVDGAYCRSDHFDPEAVALFTQGVPLAFFEIRSESEEEE